MIVLTELVYTFFFLVKKSEKMCEARYRVKILNFKFDSVGCNNDIYDDYIPLLFCNVFGL